jgi:hypothetical protein
MIAKAIFNLRPGATWVIQGEELLENLQWTDSVIERPSDEEILAEAARLQQEWTNTQYQRDRAKVYPKLQDQLDMMYWDKINGTNNWETAVQAVKDQFPKP